MRAQFVLSEIGVGLRRNLTMTFAVIISVALSLALFGGALLMREQVSTMKDYWYDKVNVSIYLCTKADAASATGKCGKGAVTAQQKEQLEADLKKVDIAPSHGTGREISEKLMERGVLVKDTHGSTIRIAPPLVISKEDLDWGLEQLRGVLSEE